MKTSAPDARRAEPRSGERGVTLLELLVVIALLGLALAALGNLVRPSSAEEALRSATRSAVNALSSARAEAIGTGRVAAVEIDTERGTIGIPGSDRVVALETGLALSARVAREASADGKARILFYPDGTATGGSLRLSAGELERRIVVHWLTGAVHVEE